MKKLVILLIAIVFLAPQVFAQEEELEEKEKVSKKDLDQQSDEMQTLFGKRKSNGGYGAISIGYSAIDNRHALHFGARGAWVIQHSFAIGFGGTGFLNEYHYDVNLDQDVFLTGGYGGLYLEPIIFPKLPVHISFPILIGAGGISFVSYNDEYYDANFVEDYEAFLIIEPGIDLELNLTRFMRLGLGVTYRLPTAFEFASTPGNSVNSQSLRGVSYNVTFKFGSF
jgi:hypothetical protein